MSLALRLHPVERESLQYDAIVSQLAAAKGLVANALDAQDTFRLRRSHPPLLSYIILLNNAAFGRSDFTVAVFSALFGAATCALLSAFVLWLYPRQPAAYAAAFLTGSLLLLQPTHLAISRTPNWDAVYGFFASACLVASAMTVHQPSTWRLAVATSAAMLAFLTSELGVYLFPVLGYILVTTWHGAASHVRMIRALAVPPLLLFLLLWPGGLIKLDVLRTLVFRYSDARLVERNLPWHMFFTYLFEQAPLFAAFTVLVLSCTLGWLVVMVYGWVYRPRGWRLSARARVVSPVLVYILICLVGSVFQKRVYPHHIVDLYPPIAMTAGCIVAALACRGATIDRVLRILTIVCIALAIPAVCTTEARVVGPEEHPGYAGVRDYLVQQRRMNGYYYYASIMNDYYGTGDVHLEDGGANYWAPQKVERIKAARYGLIIADWSGFADARFGYVDSAWVDLTRQIPNARVLAEALSPQYTLAHEVRHRRTGEPVAWIYEAR